MEIVPKIFLQNNFEDTKSSGLVKLFRILVRVPVLKKNVLFTLLETSRFDWSIPRDGGTAFAGAHELGRMLEEAVLFGLYPTLFPLSETSEYRFHSNNQLLRLVLGRMSTATTTATTKPTMQVQGLLPLKASPDSASSSEASLQSLYNRAAQAFLHRDVVLAASLVVSAFALLQPPIAPIPDALDPHRRKWDILRITLESTLYASPPDRATLPESLRELLLLSPQSFITTSHAQSLALFTPSSLPRTPTSAFLPHQVLMTHVASSIQVSCPAVGRLIIEDWLSTRGQCDFIPSTGEAYEKVLELYCLHVLPRLEEWDYAKDFLTYEVELSPSKRTELQASLAKAFRENSFQTPAVMPPRLPSPTPSASSSSSSLSTISNRTAVPLNGPSKLGHRKRADSLASTASDVTVTKPSPHWNSRAPRSTPRASSRASAVRGVPNSVVATTQSPGALALIKEFLRTYLTTHRLTTLTIIFLLLPVVSFIIRLRRMRATPASASTADQVKRRLFDARGGSVLHKLWSEVGRAIWDTVRMGGGGLV